MMIVINGKWQRKRAAIAIAEIKQKSEYKEVIHITLEMCGEGLHLGIKDVSRVVKILAVMAAINLLKLSENFTLNTWWHF